MVFEALWQVKNADRIKRNITLLVTVNIWQKF